MIRSMTGFGEASATEGGSHYFLEVRSLNNKFFKAVLRLPENLAGLEAELETRLRERLSRGTVTLKIACTDEGESAAYEINTKALKKYLDALAGLNAGSVSPASLLGLPGVLQPPGNEQERYERARGVLLKLVDKACDGLIAMRGREGATIRADLEAQGRFIAERLALVKERAPAVIAEYEKRLRTRIDTLLAEASVKVEPLELVREIAVYAERTDIAEEIKRLTAHLEQFGDLVSGKDGKPVGRTLDFLAQEMLREANTIASKSPDAQVSRLTVEIKGAIDRIKEQAANVE
ncbi:MAG: YicC/YloC family endoribonuclease [Planctomycetota bacterium]|nr:YicC/YloC family endoribonuclease [Planctomycetota bacterium]